jgi:hypothetical protein
MANRNLIYKGKGQDEKLGNYRPFVSERPALQLTEDEIEYINRASV